MKTLTETLTILDTPLLFKSFPFPLLPFLSFLPSFSSTVLSLSLLLPFLSCLPSYFSSIPFFFPASFLFFLHIFLFTFLSLNLSLLSCLPFFCFYFFLPFLSSIFPTSQYFPFFSCLFLSCCPFCIHFRLSR